MKEQPQEVVPRPDTQVIGFRAWKVRLQVQDELDWSDEELQLEPLVKGHTGAWPPGKVYEAACVGGYRSEDNRPTHQPPMPGCTCGIYAYWSPAKVEKGRVESSGWTMHLHVTGLVMAYGKVILHEDGWRAQKVKPLAFELQDPKHIDREGRRLYLRAMERLAKRYEVQLKDTQDMYRMAFEFRADDWMRYVNVNRCRLRHPNGRLHVARNDYVQTIDRRMTAPIVEKADRAQVHWEVPWQEAGLSDPRYRAKDDPWGTWDKSDFVEGVRKRFKVVRRGVREWVIDAIEACPRCNEMVERGHYLAVIWDALERQDDAQPGS